MDSDKIDMRITGGFGHDGEPDIDGDVFSPEALKDIREQMTPGMNVWRNNSYAAPDDLMGQVSAVRPLINGVEVTIDLETENPNAVRFFQGVAGKGTRFGTSIGYTIRDYDMRYRTRWQRALHRIGMRYSRARSLTQTLIRQGPTPGMDIKHLDLQSVNFVPLGEIVPGSNPQRDVYGAIAITPINAEEALKRYDDAMERVKARWRERNEP